MISSELRTKPGINGFYIGDGVDVILEEPGIKLADVADSVPQDLRGWRFPLYMVDMRRYWNDQPLYVLDELNAYTWGARVAVDGPPVERTDAVSGCLEFSVYSVALCEAIKKGDPEYWGDERGDALREYLRVCLNLAADAFEIGKDVPEFKSQRQDEFVAALGGRPDWKKKLEELKRREPDRIENYGATGNL